MAQMDRRSFLRGTTAAAAAGGVLWGLEGLVTRGGNAAAHAASSSRVPRDAAAAPGGYGRLQPTPSMDTGEVVLALPPGFRYTVFGKTDSIMKDGVKTPGLHDGMAAFAAPGGKVRLVRNHEVRGDPSAAVVGGSAAFDTFAGGGTTTLIVDPRTRLLEQDFVSLSGTLANCAGGPTPWGTWITCEETVEGTKKGFGKEHGYCFEVTTTKPGQHSTPVPLTAMGRFVHEAIAVDPATGIVYLTEDRKTSGFFRFLPKKPGKLAEGGRLQMLCIKDAPGFDTRTKQTVGKPLSVTWVPIDDPDPRNAEADDLAVYKEGVSKGAATFARLEGCWYGSGNIFLDATNGGDKSLGQIWRYEPMGADEGRLILLFESPDAAVLAMPDNLCVSPRGGLVLCEDSEEPSQFVRGLTPGGEIFDFARNMVAGNEDSEFAGATFSPDGQTLFLNVQTPGLTCAIWGPWERGAL